MTGRPAGLTTRLIHGGEGGSEGAHADSTRRGVVGVEERSTTFRLDPQADEALASRRGVDHIDVYARFGTETTREAARLVAELEGAEHAVLTASGMAAIHAVFVSLVPAGGRIAVADGVYGGTDGLLDDDLAARGVSVVRFDPTDAADLRRALGAARADLVWCEAISNPCMHVADLEGIAGICRATGSRLGVDATFAAGMAVRPLELGADVVMHSATKFLNGHSDVIAGVVAGSVSLLAPIYGAMTRVGGCIDPHGAWLLARGIKTLPLRWARQEASAQRLAQMLQAHPKVRRVHYPGLAGQGGERLRRPGAMLSFDVGDADAARAFVFGLSVCTHATSLGGLETLVSVPARSSHATLPVERLTALGIGPGLVRISVGIEEVEDLERDVLDALERLPGDRRP